MATIYYDIDYGSPLFTATLEDNSVSPPVVVQTQNNLSIGQHWFTGVDDGSYIIRIIGSDDCEIVLDADVYCLTTTTTTICNVSLHIIEWECKDVTTTTTTTIDSVENCDVFLVTGVELSGDYKLYTYNPQTKSLTYRFSYDTYSRDVAATNTRLWIPDDTMSAIKEYIITLNPWSCTYNRSLVVLGDAINGAGLEIVYADDVANKYIFVGEKAGTNELRHVTFDNSTIGVVTTLFTIDTNVILGDISYDASLDYYTISAKDAFDKRLIICYNATGTPLWTLDVTEEANRIYGLFIYNNTLYGIDELMSSSLVYEITNTLSLYDTLDGIEVQGAAQSFYCGSYLTTTTTTSEPTTTTTTTCNPLKCDYGLLYNWYAVDTGKLAPTGWHVPAVTEWETLRLYVASQGWNYDGTMDSGTPTDNKQGKALSSVCNWGYSATNGAVGNTDYTEKRNVSGFSALPGGIRSAGIFYIIGEKGWWWSTTETFDPIIRDVWGYHIRCDYVGFHQYHASYSTGESVRCVRDYYEGWENDVPVVDYDGNEYDVVEIGTQLWLVQNLKVTHYNDGESIPNVEDNSTWSNLTIGALCAYDNDWETYACVPEPPVYTTTTTTTVEPTTTTTTTVEPTTTTTTTVYQPEGCVEYGYLYNWYAATDVRNIAASGWHVPTTDEWETLQSTIGGTIYGYKLKETGIVYWNSPNTGATNELGFTARAGGNRGGNSGSFASIKNYGSFKASNYDNEGGTGRSGIILTYNSEWLYFLYASGGDIDVSKRNGDSIRLVKDDSILEHYTGNDGKEYQTVKIGTQVWMAENLAETKYANNDDIPYVYGDSDWEALTSGARCAYNNDCTYVGCDEVCPTTTTTTTTCELPEGLTPLPIFVSISAENPIEEIFADGTWETACDIFTLWNEDLGRNVQGVFVNVYITAFELGGFVYSEETCEYLEDGFYTTEGIIEVVDGEIIYIYSYPCRTTTTTTTVP